MFLLLWPLFSQVVAIEAGFLPEYCSSEIEELVSTCLFVTDPSNCTMTDPCFYSNYPACSDVIYVQEGEGENRTYNDYELVCFPYIERSCFLNRVRINDEWHPIWRREDHEEHGSEDTEDWLQEAEIIFHHEEFCPELVNTCVRNTYITETETEGIYVLLFIFFSIILGSIVRFFINFTHVNLPYTSIIFFLGLVFALIDIYYPSSLGHISVAIRVVDNINPELLLGVFIPALIFESAFSTDYHIVKKEMASAVLLAGPGVVMNTFITAGFAMLWPYGWDFTQALLFGCIVSATDPVAVVSLLRDLGASKQLATLIEGESLLNDGTAFVGFTVLVEFAKGESLSVGDVCLKFFVLVVGGIGIGILGAMITTKWISLIFNDAAIEISSSLWSCYIVFHVAEVELKASGVLAVVFLGFLMSRDKYVFSPEIEHSLHNFWEIISYLANTLIFLLAGIILIKENLNGCGFTYITWRDYFHGFGMYIGVHVSRGITMLTMYPLLKRWGYGSFQLDLKQVGIITYGGLRGAIGLALALMTVQNTDIEQSFRARVVFHVSIIVLLTLFINATTIGYIVKYLGLTKLGEYEKMVVKNIFDHISEILERERRAMVISPKYSCADWREVEKMMPDYKHVFDSEDLFLVRNVTKKFIPEQKRKSRWKRLVDGHDTPEKKAAAPRAGEEMKSELKRSTSDMEMADISIFHMAPEFRTTIRTTVTAKQQDEKFMVQQVNYRLLMIMRAHWWSQFEGGLITEECVQLLMEAANVAMDSNSFKELEKFLAKEFHQPILERLHSSCLGSLWYFRSLLEKLISNHLEIAIELSYEFITSTKRAKILLKTALEDWIARQTQDDENLVVKTIQTARDQSISELEEVVKKIRDLCLNSEKRYHDLLQRIQTRRAVARLLHLEDEILVKMYHSGMLSENEKVRFQNEIEEKMLKLHNAHVKDHYKKYPPSSSQQLARTMLLVQSFLPHQMTRCHQQEIISKLKLQRRKKDEFIFQAGDKDPSIILITPPICVAKVELKPSEGMNAGENDCLVLPGEVFAYDFLCNKEYSMSLKAITDVYFYKITYDNLKEIYEDQDPDQELLLRERLWQLAAAQILTRFFPKVVDHGSFSEVLKLIDSSIIIRISKAVDTLEIPPNKAFLLKGETIEPSQQEAPMVLSNLGFPLTFSVGSIIIFFAYPPETLVKHSIPMFGSTEFSSSNNGSHHFLEEIKQQKEIRKELESVHGPLLVPDDNDWPCIMKIGERKESQKLTSYVHKHLTRHRALSENVKKRDRASRHADL